MNSISVNKEWSLKVALYPVIYRKVVPLNPYDKVLLRILSIHEGVIHKEKFGLLLGFGMKNDKAQNIYKDAAEIQLFEYFLKELEDFHLITKACDVETRTEQIVLAYWGKKALEDGIKYTFHKGLFPAYDHLYLKYEESKNNFFPFNKFPLKFLLKQESKAEPYYLEKQVSENAIFLLEKINSNLNHSKQNPIIDYVIPERKSLFEELTQITISLINEGNGNSIEINIEDNPLPELDELLKKVENKEIHDDLLLFAEWEALLKNATTLNAANLSKYRKYVDWRSILKDKRIVWTDELFEILTNDNVSTGSIWIEVAKHCPQNILKLKLDGYKDYLSWLTLTERMDVGFIINSYTKYQWDTEILLERANPSQTEQLLSLNILEDEYLDWSIITKKISDEFVEENIDEIDFDLKFLTIDRPDLCKRLLVDYPDKCWDWRVVSAEYDLLFLLSKVEAFSKHLDLTMLIPRFLNAKDGIFSLFQRSPTFLNLLQTFSLLEDRRFYISANSEVFLDKKRLEFLDKYKLAFWGEGNIAGIEANKKLIWSEGLFQSFQSKINSISGKKHASQTIPSLSIVKKHPDFEWDFQVLSDREGFIDDLKFIEQHKQKLNFSHLINAVPLDLLQNELSFFEEWASNSEQLEIFVNCIQHRFGFQQLLNIISFYDLYELDFDWRSVISHSTETEIENTFILHQQTIPKLNSNSLITNLITQKLSLDFILTNVDLNWNWKVVTTEKLSNEQLRNKEVLSAYAQKIYWAHIIKKVFTYEEINIDNRLPEFAAYVSVASEENQTMAWTAITEKLPTHELWKAIEATEGNEMFRWNWSFISSTNRITQHFSFDNLIRFESKIDWEQLSKNLHLNHIWKYSKNAFRSYHDWRDFVLEYLIPFQKNWDFKLLSKISSITWSADIIDQFKDKWNWDVLSKESNLFTMKKGGEVFFHSKNLRLFSDKVNWEILSARYEVTIPEKDFKQYLDKYWDFQILSTHPKLALSFEVLKETSDKNWNWKALTKHSDIRLNKELLLGRKIENNQIEKVEEWDWIKTKEWDWAFLSNANWLDGELLKEFSDKEWDWKVISENKAILFDKSLIELVLTKENINWSAIIKNHKTHVNSETLRLLESAIILSKEDWSIVSAHPNLNFTQLNNKSKPFFDWNFVERYSDLWDWRELVSKKKVDISRIEVLRRFKEKMDWNQISGLSDFELKMEILQEFSDKLNWDKLSERLPLTEEILNKFDMYLNWDFISKNTSIPFSSDLLLKFEKKWNYLLLKKNITIKDSPETKEYIEEYIARNKELQFYFKIKEEYSNWAGNIYHFTHITNAAKIINSRRILSRNKATSFADAAGSVVGRRQTAHDFARFYFRPQTPTQFYNECLGKDIKSGYEKTWKYWTPETGWVYKSKWVTHYPQAKRLGLPKCPIPVFFKFDLQEVLLHIPEKCFASTGNMQTNWAKYYPVSEVLSYFNYQDVYSTIKNTSDDNWRTYLNYSQQEFLIKEEFDFSQLKKMKIIVRTEEDRCQLLQLLEPDDPIRNMVVVDNYEYNIFHNENRKIEYHFDDKKLSLNSDYTGDGFSSGYFLIEISKHSDIEIINGSVLQKKGNTILAYPSVEILFSNAPSFSAKFIDESNRIWTIIQNEKGESSQISSSNFKSFFKTYEPNSIIQYFKDNYEDLRSFYEQKVRHYTLEKHTLLVANQFELYFSEFFNQEFENLIDINLFRIFLILHDIGKPKAFLQGNKDDQYYHSAEIIKKIWSDLPYDESQLKLILTFLKGDFLGEYFQNKITIEECVSKLISANDDTELPVEFFLKAFIIYYQCDTAAYTKDAGGFPFLEHVFDYDNGKKYFNKVEGILYFSERFNRRYDKLKKEILKYGNNIS